MKDDNKYTELPSVRYNVFHCMLLESKTVHLDAAGRFKLIKRSRYLRVSEQLEEVDSTAAYVALQCKETR
jgi:hypothetical protein